MKKTASKLVVGRPAGKDWSGSGAAPDEGSSRGIVTIAIDYRQRLRPAGPASGGGADHAEFDPREQPLAEVTTQSDGRFALSPPQSVPGGLTVQIKRAHFKEVSIELDSAAIESLRGGQTVVLPDTILLRRTSLAFWIATLVFVAILVIIAAGRLHNTLAALVGATLVFAVSYLGRPLAEDLFIRKQLYQFALETRAEMMVMGRPTRSPGRNVFKADEFEAFVAELERQGNLRIIQVTPSLAAEKRP